jgi:hypothetical protein
MSGLQPTPADHQVWVRNTLKAVVSETSPAQTGWLEVAGSVSSKSGKADLALHR